jgi:hypothetical protein
MARYLAAIHGVLKSCAWLPTSPQAIMQHFAHARLRESERSTPYERFQGVRSET